LLCDVARFDDLDLAFDRCIGQRRLEHSLQIDDIGLLGLVKDRLIGGVERGEARDCKKRQNRQCDQRGQDRPFTMLDDPHQHHDKRFILRLR